MSSKNDNARINEILVPNMRRYMRESGIDVYTDPGKYAETGLSLLISTYIANVPLKEPKEGQRPTAVKRNMARDYLMGTDLILTDQPRTILMQNILRLDFTIGLTGKNYMPLVTPSSDMRLEKDCNRGVVRFRNGDYMRFGIRIGNGKHGFDDPVVVAGLCSSREIDPSRIRENIMYLHEHVMDSAPVIIRAASRTMARFRYMTDPAYAKSLDDRNSPEDIDRILPALVGNWAYLRQEAPHAKARAEKGASRTCLANVADAIGRLELDDNDYPRSADTGVPWMSPAGHAAVKAMTEGPRRMPVSEKEYLQGIRDLILAEDVRGKGEAPPLIINQAGKRLDDQPYREALRSLVAHLGKEFDDGGGAPRGPSK